MPRRKKLPKIPDYTGIPQDDSKLIVQKSNPLQTLSETDMSLSEFKILDAYLGKIDSHNAEKRYVRFEKGELEKILGVTQLKEDDLKNRLKNLFQVVTIRDKHKKQGFTMIALFEKAEAFKDDDGLWQIDLACTESAMEYVFNVEVMGYLPYMLKNVIELTSRYSYILYLYLESNRFKKTWKISIEELKRMLNCTAERYDEYKYFNAEILKKCHKELNEKTTLHFSYTPTDKKGRKYTSIQFTVETLPKIAVVDLTPEEIEEKQNLFSEEKYSNDEIAFLASACDYEFSENEMEFFFSFLTEHQAKLPPNDMGIKFARYHYLAAKFKELNIYTERKKVANRFNYLKKMIENDLKGA